MQGSDPSRHMERLLRDDEELVWNSKPQKRAFYVTSILGGLLALGFLGMFFLFPFLGFAAVLVAGMAGSPESAVALGTGVGIVGMIAVVGLVYAGTRWQYKHAEFALTDDRAIKTSGLVGRDSSTISLEDVRDIDVYVGLVDKLFGTGRVELQVAGGGNSGAKFNYIEEPYQVMETLEDTRSRAKRAAAPGAD